MVEFANTLIDDPVADTVGTAGLILNVIAVIAFPSACSPSKEPPVRLSNMATPRSFRPMKGRFRRRRSRQVYSGPNLAHRCRIVSCRRSRRGPA